MFMNNYGKLIDTNALQFERILPGPIERVWEYLVDGSKRALWFAGGSTDLVPNGKMELIFRNSQLGSVPEPTPEKFREFGDGYVSEAIVLKISKPNLLVIQWEGIVTFELKETDDGLVQLILTHEKLKEDPNTRIQTLAGWHTHLNILDNRLNNQEVNGFWSMYNKLESEYDQQINE